MGFVDMVLSTLQREEQSEAFKSNLDLVLITITLLTSINLSLTPRSQNLSHTRRPVRCALIILNAFLATATALVIAIVALVLGWKKSISPDALSGIVFALAASLTQVPTDTLNYASLVYYMRRRKSLRIRPEQFRFIRYGKPCKTWLTGKLGLWNDNFDSKCQMENCQVAMYIRWLPMKKYHPILRFFKRKPQHGSFACENKVTNEQSFWKSLFGPHGIAKARSSHSASSDVCLNDHEDSPRPTEIADIEAGPANPADDSANPTSRGTTQLRRRRQETIQWYGRRVGHTKNFVELRDLDEGITAWWFNAVSSATGLLNNPLQCDVKDASAMLNALALLVDIISIGDLVFAVRGEYLRELWENDDDIRKAKTGTPGIMCCKIMKKLGLESWARHHHDMWRVPFERNERHSNGILFAILATKSDMFVDKGEPIDCCPDGNCAQCLQRCENEDCIADWCPCFINVSKRERKSAQDVLDKIMLAGNSDPEEFAEVCRTQADEWLREWGCSPRQSS